MTLVAAGFAGVFYRRSVGRNVNGRGTGEVPLRNPFSLIAAAKFAAFFAAVLLLVKGVQLHFPSGGIYLVSAVAGLTDVDAITLSMAEHAKANDPASAVTAIVLAALTNTLVKCGMVTSLSSSAVRRPVLLPTGAVLLAGLGAIILMRLI